MALDAPALVALCTVAVAEKKTAQRTAGASTATGHNSVDSSKMVTKQTW